MSLFRNAVTCFILFSTLMNAVISLNPQTCRECVSRNTCHPPACSCCNDNMPILSRNNTPQMVFFTFDDAITPTVANFYRELFDSNRTNPNGCPIKMTLFVSHANTVYSLVREFYRKGMEIGAHSVSHGHMNERTFKSEAKLQKENIARMAGVPMSEIKGWRSPFLEPVGDTQPKSLNELDYTYDATLTITKKGLKKPPIPFTLDYGWPYDCKIKPCPMSAHNGFWEVPVISVMDHLERFDCVYVDGCHTPPPNEETAFKFLWNNFNTYYSGNRAPFGMNMHASWFYYPDRLRAMDRFIKVLSNLPDVYLVSVSQVIDWLKTPTALSDIHHFKPWGCKNPKKTSHHHRRFHAEPPRVKTSHGASRANSLHQHIEQQRRLRVQQAKVNFMQRQQQRKKAQQTLLQQRGIQNLQHGGTQQSNTVQKKKNKVPIASGTLGYQQYMWLQRQRARPRMNARKQSSLASARRSRISWQQALRHQVMHHVQQSVPSTTPSALLGALINRKPTKPSKEVLLRKRQREQLEKQKRLLKERQEAEQKVIAEETRIAVKKRKDALIHAEKEKLLKSKVRRPNKSIGMTTATPVLQNMVHTKKELRELLRFAESKLVQSRLLFGVGKQPGLQEQKQTIRPLSELKSHITSEKQQEIVTSTATPIKVKASKVSKLARHNEFPTAKQDINSHNFLLDSFKDVVGNNKELWTWAIPKKRQSKKVIKLQSTLPPIKVATTGGFIDFNPTTVYSSPRTSSPEVKSVKGSSTKEQTTVQPIFKVTSLKYSFPEEATLIEPNRGLDRSIAPLSMGPKHTDMPPVLSRETCKQGVTCSLPECKCLSSTIPGGLKPTEIPQIIYITVDGDINFSGFTKMRSMFSRKRKNPNGCPIGGTMFVSPIRSSVRLVDRIHKDNVEIAVQGSKPREQPSGSIFSSDIDEYRSKLSKSTTLLPNQITGYRGLDFQPPTDNEMLVLHNKSMYDSSMITKAKVWPFTLDYGWKGTCKNVACPMDTYAGVWEVPIIPLINSKAKESCNYADGCKSQPNTKEDTSKFLQENFNRHYKSTRSPFGIHLSQKWFHWYYNHNLSGLNNFLNHVLLLPDVYIVSISDMIGWVKQPTALKHLKEFQPWRC
ncbi:uncharacterized protein LOC110445427 [Mizuhopecten yessoensis]|uniref:NodB homology domain-containing protein n=1 Tax=Mizuhopecten yessoensis TaxID=6573 RepID=A0A210QZL0_MIZYE|nr:uncharacterized protein LOC110445427 [Mizuhopecten yessoensis]OWF54209.1 hypothetical protein KP79_PYT00366 [Mizuhopecten yessoensis]